jgi:Flp pilus assembly protein TadD
MVTVGAVGCFQAAGVPEHIYERALLLVDEGTMQLREQKFIEAEATFAIAREMAPLAAAVDGKGCALMMQGRFDEAEQLFREAYDMDKEYDEALGNLALLYDVRGEPARAREVYELFLRTNPEVGTVRNNYAGLLYDLGVDHSTVQRELLKARVVSGNVFVETNITEVGRAIDGKDREANATEARGY